MICRSIQVSQIRHFNLTRDTIELMWYYKNNVNQYYYSVNKVLIQLILCIYINIYTLNFSTLTMKIKLEWTTRYSTLNLAFTNLSVSFKMSVIGSKWNWWILLNSAVV